MTLPANAISAGQPNDAAEGPSAMTHADEADEHRRPSPPADLLAEEQRRHHRHVDRPGEVVGHRVGERQVAHRPVEAASSRPCAEDRASELQPRPLDMRSSCRQPMLPDDRHQHERRGEAPEEQDLRRRVTSPASHLPSASFIENRKMPPSISADAERNVLFARPMMPEAVDAPSTAPLMPPRHYVGAPAVA